MQKRLAIITMFLMIIASVWGQDNRFNSANSLYQAGKFGEAATAYEDILKTGIESKALYFNLGNAYYKSGNLPKAILNYERAKIVAPNDKDVQYNLDLANSQTTDRISEVQPFFLTSWISSLIDKGSSDFWAWVFIILFVMVLMALGFYLYSTNGNIKRISFFGGIFITLVMIVSLSFSHAQKSNFTNRNEAIIFTPTVSVKSSPDNSGTEIFVIHEATKVKILESLGQWKKIELKSGQQGWIPADTFERI
jgi:tetratricopeptide (TPR) repeat protein